MTSDTSIFRPAASQAPTVRNLDRSLCITGQEHHFLSLGRPERQFRRGLCLAADVFFRPPFSEVPRPIALKLCHMIGNWPYFIMQVQKFGGYASKKWWPITCEISVNFLPLQTFIANISGRRQHIKNRKDVRSRAIPPEFDEKVR